MGAGTRVGAIEEREENDFYATEPKALEKLLEVFTFHRDVWEPACGQGHLSKVLMDQGYNVWSTDKIDRGFGYTLDFLDLLPSTKNVKRDIITNPPFRFALEFAETALDVVAKNYYVALFLKLQFLEGAKRRSFFDTTPPRYVYVSSSRLRVAKHGDFDQFSSAATIAYAWFIWQKGFNGEPTIKWFN